MTNEKQGVHYAWFILIGCCCCFAGGMALTFSIAGVYIGPLGKALNLGPGDIGLWIAVSGPFSVISSPIWGNLVATKNINFVATLGSILMIIGVLIFAFASAHWMILTAGAFIGAALPLWASIIGPTLITNWFTAEIRGRMLGIAAAFTGVGTFIWAPLFTLLVNTAGIQTAYLINAALMALLLLPWSLFVFKSKPSDKGLEPFGPKSAKSETLAGATTVGMKVVSAMKTPAFWFAFVAVAFCSLGMGFNSNQPKFAEEFLVPGYMDAAAAALFGASMISVAAVGNIIGKIIFGAMTDKFGLRITLLIFLVLFALAFIFWLLFKNPTMMLVAAFLLGTHNALPSVGLPLLARTLFGGKNFSKIWGITHMGSSLVGGFGTAIVGYTYQFTGSYNSAMLFGIALVCVVGVFGMISTIWFGKLKFNDVEEASTAKTA
jgi:MFS family permease